MKTGGDGIVSGNDNTVRSSFTAKFDAKFGQVDAIMQRKETLKSKQ